MCSGVPSTAETCTPALFTQFSINVKQMQLEKVSLSQIWNLRFLFYHVGGLSHAFSSELRGIPATSSDAIIFKTIYYFLKFYSIFEISMKCYAFWKKKHQLHSLVNLEVIASKYCGYLNVRNVLKTYLNQHSSSFYLIL